MCYHRKNQSCSPQHSARTEEWRAEKVTAPLFTVEVAIRHLWNQFKTLRTSVFCRARTRLREMHIPFKAFPQ